MPSETQVSIEDALRYINEALVQRSIRSVIVHHTWRPTAAEYRGLATIRAVRQYHTNVRGWSDNGYHIMIGPPGDIFLCRPLRRAGAHCKGQNAHSVGVSYVANFDVEDPADYPGLETGQRIVAALLQRFGLGPEAVHFHRDYAPKSCPGWNLKLDAYRDAVAALLQQATSGGVQVVLLPGSKVIECKARLEHGTTRVDLRPVAEALGYEVLDRIKEQGKVFLRPYA